MTQPVVDSDETWPLRIVLERAVSRWLDSWSPLPMPAPLDDVMLGELDRAITGSLVAAGMIDAE